MGYMKRRDGGEAAAAACWYSGIIGAEGRMEGVLGEFEAFHLERARDDTENASRDEEGLILAVEEMNTRKRKKDLDSQRDDLYVYSARIYTKTRCIPSASTTSSRQVAKRSCSPTIDPLLHSSIASVPPNLADMLRSMAWNESVSAQTGLGLGKTILDAAFCRRGRDAEAVGHSGHTERRRGLRH